MTDRNIHHIDIVLLEDVSHLRDEHIELINGYGGRFSMGGQIATENTLFIDMSGLNKILAFSKERKEITVQAGVRWKDIQEYIDLHGLSVRIMQTYNNFTIGGSLSVNVHGRYIGEGPLIGSVKSIRVVLANGELVDASPDGNKDIFYGVIGGYGGLGVIVEAKLALADNATIERTHKKMPIEGYSDYFKQNIRNNSKVVFHNADIYPDEYKNVSAVSWIEADKPLTNTVPFKPIKESFWLEKSIYFWITELPLGHWVRENLIEPYIYSSPAVVKRNYESSYDVSELEPSSRQFSTYALQEYFTKGYRPLVLLDSTLNLLNR